MTKDIEAPPIEERRGPCLAALNGSTLTQPKGGTGGLWHPLLKGDLSNRVSKVWRDGRAKVLDHESNKIIGAPLPGSPASPARTS